MAVFLKNTNSMGRFRKTRRTRRGGNFLTDMFKSSEQPQTQPSSNPLSSALSGVTGTLSSTFNGVAESAQGLFGPKKTSPTETGA
jgi:hypothetical protein